jgi:integrase
MEEKEHCTIKTRKDGKPLTIRHNRDRFLYPAEWDALYKVLNPRQKFVFEFLLHTGARINEARNVKVEDIDLKRRRLILRITKIKAKKGQTHPKPRTISFSTQMAKRLKKHIKGLKLKGDDYLGILSTPGANIALKKGLQKAGVKDYYMVSVHNLRKTQGNWLKAMGIDAGEICSRLGHDYNTFLSNYASSDIFTYEEKQHIRHILGDLVQQLKGEKI